MDRVILKMSIFAFLMMFTTAMSIDNEVFSQSNKPKPQENSVAFEKNIYFVEEAVPCQMVYSSYGCCWDQKSIPTGPNGEGCPVCKNQKHKRCKNWKRLCYDKAVRETCPETCNACPETKVQNLCEDGNVWKTQCATFKILQLCYLPDFSKHCKKTCSVC